MPPTNAPDDSATILVVDDHHGNVLAMEAALESLGYTIVTASSGPEAIDIVRARELVTILMDVHMPGMDGYDTVTRIREIDQARDVPIIFVTAVYDRPEHVRRGYALGAVDYVAKPFDDFVLRAKVRALVSLYRRGREIERRRAVEYERVKDMFFSAVGHDLGNPLTAILMASKLLRRHACPEPTHDAHARRIERAAERMRAIVDDILDLARGQFAGGIPLAPQPTDLGDVCRAVAGEATLAHADRAIQVQITGDVTGTWDPNRLARVASNLVGNAVVHGAGGPVRVLVEGRADEVVLEVHNAADPIPDEELAQLFAPFRRRGDRGPGLGLGLHIVHEIIRAHGGKVKARSADGETVFTVTLPRTARVGVEGAAPPVG